MSVLPTGLTKPASGYTIDNSCRFDKASTSYLSRTPSSAGNRKTWTWSGWLKLGKLSSQMGTYSMIFGQVTGTPSNGLWIDDNDRIYIWVDGGVKRISTLKLRDPNAWYHMVMAVDTTSGTAAYRFRVYINNVEVTSWSTDNAITQNNDLGVNASGSLMTIGKRQSEDYYDGLMAEIHFIDGTQLTPSSFGEAGDYGEWKPKEVSGLTYGTNGFYLDFADAADLGDDESGEGNDFAETNIASSDQMLDTPTNNFCTMNNLDKNGAITFSEGNLKLTKSGSTWTASEVRATFGVSSGKWYFEMYHGTTHEYGMIGITELAGVSDFPSEDYGTPNGLWTYEASGTKHGNTDTGSGASYGADWHEVVTMSCALNMDDGEITFYKGGSTQGVAYSSSIAGKEVFPMVAMHQDTEWMVMNFGQDGTFAGNVTAGDNADDNGYGNFLYDVPTGFLALCTKNLPEPAVVPSEHFNTVTYTGTGASQTIRGVGFQPDFLIVKSRSNSSNHSSMNAITGAGNTLYTNGTNAEIDYTAYITDFDADGFDTGTEGGVVNYTDYTYVAWNWKANGSGSSNEDGTINTTSTSANTSAGFSISTYTGTGSDATVGHGLSQAPELFIVKSRDTAYNWGVYSSALTSADYALQLNTTIAQSNTWDYWNDLDPTSSVINIGTENGSNDSGDKYILYCFHSVEGYSKIGSYEGNANADGAFVYCGFRPAFVMTKNIDASGQNWMMFDNKRDTYNLSENRLRANDSAVEGSDNQMDILSNGFKLRTDNQSSNGSESLLFIAFAETPFKYANAR